MRHRVEKQRAGDAGLRSVIGGHHGELVGCPTGGHTPELKLPKAQERVGGHEEVGPEDTGGVPGPRTVGHRGDGHRSKRPGVCRDGPPHSTPDIVPKDG